MKKLRITRKVSGKRYSSIIFNKINGIINKKALLINKKETIAVFFIPRTFTKVFVPALLSAFASRMSFVEVPPNKNIAAIHPIDRGKLWKGSPNTLHDPKIPRNPLGIATHTWFKNRNFFILGGKEYVIEKNAISRINKLKVLFIVIDNSTANINNP